MKTGEFLEALLELARQQLPPELSGFQVTGPTMSLAKLHYGRPTVHYEVWIQKRRGEAELGLHFEGDAESNLRHLEPLNDDFLVELSFKLSAMIRTLEPLLRAVKSQ